MMVRRIAWLVLCVPLAACTGGAATSASPPPTGPGTSASAPISGTSIVLREAPVEPACDAIGMDPAPRRLTFTIDPGATEQVSASTDTGVTFATYWSPGFQPGTDAERVIRDPAGQVVVTDGDALDIPEGAPLRLQSYLVLLCPGGAEDALYVLLEDPA
jgi:hypothetical protein